MWPHKRTQNVKRVHAQEEHFFIAIFQKTKLYMNLCYRFIKLLKGILPMKAYKAYYTTTES